MLPVMTAIPDPGRWVKVRLPNGRPAMVTTKYEQGRRLVVVKPIRDEE
jgi:hypothetical protein